MGASIIVDAFWGDSGKGKIADHVARTRGAACCVRAGTGTNAGHSIWLDDKTLLKTHQIPLAGLTGTAALRVGSGVAVDPETLFDEVARYDRAHAVRDRVRVDRRCPVIEPEYRDRETHSAHLAGTVGSTCSGTGIAQAAFALREARQATDVPELRPYVTDVAREVNEWCLQGERVVVEGSQGTFLSLALTDNYPCCTSGNCTTAALADDVGLNWQHIDEVILVVKAMPTRVGTGPLPYQMSEEEQDRLGIAEFGVRTGRRRRKASAIDWDLLRYSVMLNGPTGIALTFCDHYDADTRRTGKVTARVEDLAADVERETGVPVVMLEVGKMVDQVVAV